MAKSLLGERYELLDQLGSGGMATVWRGRDRRLHREVAVKILSEQLASNQAFRARFEREAMHVASLKHPNVVTIYDYGSEGDTYYIVMELVEGESLQSRLDATAPYLGLELTLRLTGEALAGLSHAHLKGIIHRDLKPANILITHEETAKLADFGIARAVNEVAGLTTTGSFIGTPSYSSPEQLSGLPATVSTDIYSLGCVLYECLTGRPPFEAEMPAGVMAQHLQAVPRPPRQYRSEIPPSVEAVVLKALEKDPALRFATAKDMGQALTDGIVPTREPADNRSTVVRPEVTPPSADGPSGPRRHRRRLTLLAIGGAMALVAAAVAIPLVLLAGGHSGSVSPTTSTTSTASSLASPKTSAFDSCLVGSWTVDAATLPFQVSASQTVPISGAQGTRTVITPDGTEADNFDASAPLEGTINGQPLTVTLRGSASTLLSSSNGTVSVQPGSTSGVSATATLGGARQSAPLPPATAGTQYSYTCGSTSFSITRQGERVVYSRQ